MQNLRCLCLAGLLLLTTVPAIFTQERAGSALLTIDRIFNSGELYPQRFTSTRWTEAGNSYTTLEPSGEYPRARDIVAYEMESGDRKVLVEANQLIPRGQYRPLSIYDYHWSNNGRLLLVFTNTQRVWRYHTRGDYWLLDLESGQLKQLGSGLPESSLMFTKFSPDDSKVAYVSQHNIYVEELANGRITQLTLDGSDRLINGTFDWAYEEEFSCRDGFRLEPRRFAYSLLAG